MSQYPSPYNPPSFPTNFNYYAPAGDDLIAPSRRAGVLLIVLGSLAALFGLCVGVAFAVIPMEQLLAQGSLPPEAINGASPQMLKTVMLVVAALVALGGIIAAALGIFVWRASRPATIAALVLSILAELFLVIQVVSALAMAAAHPNPQMMLSVCMIAVPFGGFILAIVWLVQALRSSGRLQLAQQQYQMQLWQSQQQAYQQPPGYGYAPPANPQTPAPQQMPYPYLTSASTEGAAPTTPVRHPPLPPSAPDKSADDDANGDH